MTLNFTARERAIIGAARRGQWGSSYQPQREDLDLAEALIARGMLAKREEWDCLEATAEGEDAYYADLDDIAEERLQRELLVSRRRA